MTGSIEYRIKDNDELGENKLTDGLADLVLPNGVPMSFEVIDGVKAWRAEGIQ